MKSRIWVVPLVLAVLAMALAACGDSDDGTGGSESASAESGASSGEAENVSGMEPPVTDPNEIENPITEPLSKKPPAGKKVVFLQCELPACERFVGGMEGATAALGWELETIVFPSADPGKGVETALVKNPDYIAMSGVPQEVIKGQMAKATKAGVPIVSCSTVEKGKPGGFAAQCESTQVNESEELAKWMYQDSGGEAQILGLTLPLYPILGTQTEYLEGEFLQQCPDCGYESLDLTPEDLGEGAVGQKVVGVLQQNPEIEYVYSTFADPTTGLRPVLDSAGLTDVKIVTAAGNATTMQEIPDDVAAATQTPNQYMSWQMVDALARISVGTDVAKDAAYQELLAETPIYVIDSADAVERLAQSEYNWAGPGDGAYEGEFEELWQVK